MTTQTDQIKEEYVLPVLPYDFSALEPVISGEIMELHYTKHHKTYLTNLNQALEKFYQAEQRRDLGAQIALQQAIRFNGGGHINHSIFWTNLAPKNQGGGEPPRGAFATALTAQFHSLDSFIQEFTAKTVAIQGSGWGWLGYNSATKQLQIATCANQDPLSTQALTPLLGIDVWEHAYYLQYKNVRADYLKNIWQVINWHNVAERYEKAKAA